MLAREEARRRLAAMSVADWQERRDRAIRRLPGSSREIADIVIHKRSTRSNSDLLVGIDRMKPRKRQRLFDALAPGQADAIARGWAHLVRGPYQHNIDRRPFRAPGSPHLGIERRSRWLTRMSEVVWQYGDHDVEWYAAWAPYLERGSIAVGSLLAAEVDSGPRGDAVFNTLAASARGDHPIGGMGRHVVTGLLGASRPEGWHLMERMLIAAQRQEGLRQVILETVDEAHPEAFKRMLGLVVDEKLTRFASVIRAVDVWFGVGFDVTHRTTVERLLTTVVDCLDDGGVAEKHLAGTDAEACYAALWTLAWADVGRVYRPAAELMTASEAEIRFAATHLIAQVGLSPGEPLLLDRLDDSDPRVAWRAFTGATVRHSSLAAADGFEKLEGYLARVPNKTNLEPLLWGWTEQTADPDAIIQAMVNQAGEHDRLRLAAYLPRMSANVRAAFARSLADEPTTPAVRKVFLDLTADRSQWVRRIAFEALATHSVTSEEAPAIEALLTRKTASVRRSAISLLAGQSDAGALRSAQRLMSRGTRLQREAGLDLLRLLSSADRSAEAARELAARFAEEAELTAQESHLIDAMVDGESEVATLEDCLGLIDVRHRTPAPEMRERRLAVTNGGLDGLFEAADELVRAHRDLPLRHVGAADSDTQLYGDMRWIRMADAATPDGTSLVRVWLDWWHEHSTALDAAPSTLTAAVAAVGRQRGSAPWTRTTTVEKWESALIERLLPPRPHLEYQNQVAAGLRWLWLNGFGSADVEHLLDAAESTLATIPQRIREQGPVDRRWTDRYVQPHWDWRSSSALSWISLMRGAYAGRPDVWTDAAIGRMWGILRWHDEPAPANDRLRPELSEFMAAFRTGHANDADLVDHLIGPRSRRGYSGAGLFRDLGEVTRRRPRQIVSENGVVGALVDVIVNRILEVELARGEMPTAASVPALALRSVEGAGRLVQLVVALSRRSLTRGWTWDAEATHSVLSHLIRVCVPAESDTPATFAELAAAAKLSESRLLDVAMYAPQWARYVEHALGWPGLEDAIHWMHAHTKDSSWRVDGDIRELWTAEVASRTPLTAAELTDGAVDVDWYRRARNVLGDERWIKLDKAAKYASGGGGHKRAQLFAAALAGAVEEEALHNRITGKRHQDSVRALGLVPLPAEEGPRTQAVLRRYHAVQEFLRGSKRFGSQRRASEARAAETGLANLARTAEYADPQRLQWAMETAAVADLANGALSVVRDGYTVTLMVGDRGDVRLTARNQGKLLKSIPAKLRKDPEIAELRKRKTALTRQGSRMRTALERASLRGDEFEPAEIGGLFDHPLLRPLVERLLWVGAGDRQGYLEERGAALRAVDGSVVPTGDGPLRIAHAHDLMESGNWSAWQHECFSAERIQPFKQIFRELYVLTEAERAQGTASRRYAGHQVNPRQAMALLGGRGWVTHPEYGPSRTYHDADITAHLTIVGGWLSPAEVDGMTLEVVLFTRKGEWQALPLEHLPPRLFSETMRDIDLVAGIAHIGGVDPEASASSIAMRRALVEETGVLLGIDNVSFSASHVVIDGHLGSYSVHLGSGTVHQRPGGSVCIVPVSAQHRGRLFLPFADDDPKTAEIVSKVVMLARDRDIKDPTILEQLIR